MLNTLVCSILLRGETFRFATLAFILSTEKLLQVLRLPINEINHLCSIRYIYNTIPAGEPGESGRETKKLHKPFLKELLFINRILEYACSGGTIFCLVFTGCYYQCRLGRQIQWFLLLWYQRFEENFKIISKFSKLARSYISVWLFLR